MSEAAKKEEEALELSSDAIVRDGQGEPVYAAPAPAKEWPEAPLPPACPSHDDRGHLRPEAADGTPCTCGREELAHWNPPAVPEEVARAENGVAAATKPAPATNGAKRRKRR